MRRPSRSSMSPSDLADDFRSFYSEALRDEISDAHLTPIILDSKFFAIRNPIDQETFFANSNHLDEYIVSAAPRVVELDSGRLTLWAKEALDFTYGNVDHDSFIEVFSSRLQYEPAIERLIKIDASGAFLHDYFKQLKISSVFFADVLPISFQIRLHETAVKAIRPSLNFLALRLKNRSREGLTKRSSRMKTIDDIRYEPSFRNKSGLVPFSMATGKLQMDGRNSSEQIDRCRNVLERALRKLIETRPFDGIHNIDRVLSELLIEYKIEIERTLEDVNIPMLWTLGLEIDDRLRRQAQLTSDDEKFDDDRMQALRALMIAHNILIASAPEAKDLLENIERSALIYKRIDESAKSLPGDILTRMSANLDLVELRAAQLLAKVNKHVDGGTVSQAQGRISLNLALLRGALNAAGLHTLNFAEQIVEKSSVELGTALLVEAIRSDHGAAAFLEFLKLEAVSLITLSEQAPVYFGYVRHMIDFLVVSF